MEGLYLHNLIFLALFSDTSSIYIYTFFGWGKSSNMLRDVLHSCIYEGDLRTHAHERLRFE